MTLVISTLLQKKYNALLVAILIALTLPFISQLSFFEALIIMIFSYIVALGFSRFVFAQVSGASVLIISAITQISYYASMVFVLWLTSLITLNKRYDIFESFSIRTLVSILVTSIITSFLYVVLKKSFKQTSGLFIS